MHQFELLDMIVEKKSNDSIFLTVILLQSFPTAKKSNCGIVIITTMLQCYKGDSKTTRASQNNIFFWKETMSLAIVTGERN